MEGACARREKWMMGGGGGGCYSRWFYEEGSAQRVEGEAEGHEEDKTESGLRGGRVALEVRSARVVYLTCGGCWM